MCLGVWMSLLDLDLFSKNFWHITIKIPWLPSNILKNSQISIFQMRTLLTWSSSGWVLMIRKVLPSKSMSSEEHFSYLSCPHIFNISEDIYKFMKKCHPLVSYNENHHYIWKVVQDHFFTLARKEIKVIRHVKRNIW